MPSSIAVKTTAPILRKLVGIASATALGLTVRLPAATLEWGPNGEGGDGIWSASETADWFDATQSVPWPAPGGIDDDALFAGTAGIVSIANGGIIANDLTFSTTGYSIQNQTLTLNGETPSITTASGVTTEISTIISGSKGLRKLGTGRLVLTNSNTFTGNVTLGDANGTIAAGALRIIHGNALGIGSKWVSIRNGSSFLELDGAAGNLSIPSNIAFITSGPAIRNLAGDNVIHGSIQMNNGAGSTTIQSNAGSLALNGNINAGSAARTLVLSGDSTGANRVNGAISNGSQANSLTKSGTGTWRIAHPNNTYSGDTTVSGGKLILAGKLQSANLHVATDAHLAVEGARSTSGNFTLAPGSTLELRAMPSQTDRLSVGGSVTLAGHLNLVVSPGTSGGGSYVILNNRGSQAVSGTFTNLPENGQFIKGGIAWQITYRGGDGNDVVLTREPGALQSFEQRRDLVLKSLRGRPFIQGYISPSPSYRRPESYTYMDFALRCFLNDEQIPEANAAVAAFCNQYNDNQYFDNVDWLSDMAFRILEDYGSQGRIAPGKLTQANEAAMMNLFWQYAKRDARLSDVGTSTSNIWNLPNGTENLNAMNIATLWHASKLLRNHPDYADLVYDDGSTPEAYYQASTAYYKEWLRERARKGMLVEFSNNHYGPVTLKGIYNFVDFAPDQELRELANKWLDLFWTTWAQEQMHAVKGGGMARIYQSGWGKSQSMEGLNNPFSEIFWCYTGLGRMPIPGNNVLTYLASSYRLPALAIDLATDLAGRGSYTSIERKMGRAINGTQQMDLNETFTRHSYITPDYILGTIHVGHWRYWLWQMISSQNRWHGAIFNSHPDARIFFQCTADSGGLNYNQHWSAQSRNAIVVQKLDNAGMESTRYAKYALEMKVWVASAGRSDLLERDGWVFASYGSAYAAIKVLDGGFTWRNDEEPAYPGQWMVLDKEYSPVVMELGRASDFGNFSAFQEQILGNSLTFANSIVNYQSTLGDTLTLHSNYSQSPRVNGATLNFKPTKAYDSPFVWSDFNSGVVNLQKGERQLTLDFNTQLPATYTWSAGNDVWDSSTQNWNNDSAAWPNRGSTTAIFESPSARVILTPGLYPAGLIFNADTVLSGNPLELAGWQPNLHTANGVAARFDTPLSGVSGLSKTGSGTLVFNANNALRGISRIVEGTLQIGTGGESGTIGNTSIINAGAITVHRSGTLVFPAPISGSGSISIENPSLTDTVVLAADNPFRGSLTLTRGTLRLAHSSALGSLPRQLELDGINQVLQLGGDAPVILPSSITLNASGSSLSNFSGSNRIDGDITLGGLSGITISSIDGSLHLAGNIIPSDTSHHVELSGTSRHDNLLSGLVTDATQPTSLLKSGPGTWRISGAQPFTGTTTVTDGTLILSGSLAGDVEINAGQLAVTSGASINGDLSMAPGANFEARPDTPLDVGGTLTLDGNLSVNFPRGIPVGSQFTILRKNSAGPVSGIFTGLPEASNFTASAYSWRISYFGGDGNDVVLTTLSGPTNELESWRDTHFGIVTNTGIAADNADPDGDGIINSQEYTLGTNPRDPNSPASFIWNQANNGNWTTPSNWNGNFAPPGNSSRQLVFLSGNALPGGSTTANNNFSGTYLLNRLQLAGTASATHLVNLTGGALDFRSSGGTNPSILLATAAEPISYTIAHNATLSADLTVDAMAGGQAVLSGSLSGPGGITYTGTSNNLILSGNNSHIGTTRIVGGLYPGTIRSFAGTLQIGNAGSTGSPGSGSIVNDGTLAFRRTGTLQLPNPISGSGRLMLNNPNSTDTLRISGDNSFTGDITITRGRLIITRSSALGSGEKSITATNGNARIELEGSTPGITLAPEISLNLSGTELRNATGDNIVRGDINAATGAGGTSIASNSGSLTLTGTLQTANSGGRTITLGGTSTAANTVSGRIIDGVSTLTLQKSGEGTWTLSHPDNRYTGPTTVSGGKLILRGNLTSPITVQTATLAAQGTPTTTGPLTLSSGSRFEVRPGDTLSVGSLATLAGELDILAPPGIPSATTFTILKIAGSNAASGTFTGKPEATTFSASGYEWQITYTGGDGNDVVLSNVSPPPPLTAIENWRLTHFGDAVNSGLGANDSDPNLDGESNLLEFATGQDPLAATLATSAMQPAPPGFEFVYTRSKSAYEAGYLFDVQYSDSLGPESWISVGPGTVILDAEQQRLSAPIPHTEGGRRFARLRVSAP